MTSEFATDSDERTRVGVILLACLGGFLLGDVIAILLVSTGADVSHFRGGFAALSRSSAPPWWSNALSLVGLWCGFGAAIYVAHARGHLRAPPQQWRLRASDVVFVALGVACQVLVDLAYRPFHFRHLNTPVRHLFGSAHGATFLLLAVLTTLGAPFMEEWLFRGVLYRALEEGFRSWSVRGATLSAVLVSAVLFGLAHGEPLQLPGLIFLGVVAALLFQRTGRLMPSIITHVSFNGVAMVALLAQRSTH